MCLIINTAEVRCRGTLQSFLRMLTSSQWCGVTTVSLTERIRDRIDSKWKERSVTMVPILLTLTCVCSVDLSEERENFLTVVANGIKLLVAGV